MFGLSRTKLTSLSSEILTELYSWHSIASFRKW